MDIYCRVTFRMHRTWAFSAVLTSHPLFEVTQSFLSVIHDDTWCVVPFRSKRRFPQQTQTFHLCCRRYSSNVITSLGLKV